MENKVIIQAIPELKNYPGIIRAAKEGTLVFFIGAGISKIYGLPGWDQFARNELEQLFESGFIDYQTMEKLLQSRDAKKILTLTRIIGSRGSNPKGVTTKSKEIFSVKSKDNNGLSNRIYKDLFDLNAIYITTNYDDCIDVFWHERNKVANEVKDEISEKNGNYSEHIKINHEFRGSIIYKKEEIIKSKLDTMNIIHLHGSFEDETTMLVTIPDYLNFYGVKGTHDNPGIADFLDSLFNSAYTVVFLGYGLEEFEILEYMLQKGVDGSLYPKHFLLYPTYQSEEIIVNYYFDYYKNFGITLIPYDISQKGYKQLEDIVAVWSRRLQDICKPKSNYVKIIELKELCKEINEDSTLYPHKVNVLIDYLKSNKSLEVHFFLKESVPKLFNDLIIKGFFEYSTISRAIIELRIVLEYWPQSSYLLNLVKQENSTIEIKRKVMSIYTDLLSKMKMESSDIIDYAILNSVFEIMSNLEPDEISIEVLCLITACIEKPTIVTMNAFSRSKDILVKLLDDKNENKVKEMIYIVFLLLEVNFVFISSVRRTYDNDLLCQLSEFVDEKILNRVIRHTEKFFEKSIVHSIVKINNEEFIAVAKRDNEGFQVEIREFSSYDFDSFYNNNFTEYNLIDTFSIKGFNREEFMKQTSSIIKYDEIPWNEMFSSFFTQSAYQDILVMFKDNNDVKIESLILIRDLIHNTIMSKVSYEIKQGLLDALYKSNYFVFKKLAINLLTDLMISQPAKSEEVLRSIDFDFIINSPYLSAEVKRFFNSIPLETDEVILDNIIKIINNHKTDNEENEENEVWKFKRLKELKHFRKVSELLEESFSTLDPQYEMIPMLGEVKGFDIIEEKAPISDEELSELSVDVIIDLINEFKENGRWEQPSITGLELALSRNVKNAPDKYFSGIDKLKNIKSNYYHRIISSLFDWDEENNMKESKVLLRSVREYIVRFLEVEINYEKTHEIASICKRVCEHINLKISNKKFVEDEVDEVAQLLFLLFEKSNEIEFPMKDLEAVTQTINSLQGSVIKTGILFLDFICKDVRRFPQVEETIFKYFYDYGIQKSVEFYVWFGLYASYFKHRFNDFFTKVFTKIDINTLEWLNFLEGYLYNSRVNNNIYQDMVPHLLEGFSSVKLKPNSKKRIAEHFVIGYINNFDSSMSIENLLNDLFMKEEYDNIILIINSISELYSGSEGEKLTPISKIAEKIWTYIHAKCTSKRTESDGLKKIAANSLKLMKCIGNLNTINLSEILFFVQYVDSEYIVYDVYSWLYESFESNHSAENAKKIASILLGLSKVIKFDFDYGHPVKEFIESLLIDSDETIKDIIRDIKYEFALRDDIRLIDIKLD